MTNYFLLFALLMSISMPQIMMAQSHSNKLKDTLETVINQFDGRAGIYLYHLDKNEEIAIHADDVFPTASMIKVPIMIKIFDLIDKGVLDYNQKLVHNGEHNYTYEEDLVNVAEEVKEPRRTMPRAILFSLLITSLLYVAVGLVTVLSASTKDLAAAESPLSVVLGDWRLAGDAIAVVGMLAGLNGALVQVVMASRVLYGLAGKRHAPALFERVHPWTSTPWEATAAITAVVLLLALWFPLEGLAAATSSILLAVYALVNLSLWQIKGTDPLPPEGAPNYPRWLPLLGACVTTAFLIFHMVSLVRETWG